MFIPRHIAKHILSGAQQVPVVAIIGPRQSGKSTIAKELFSKHLYLDMQDAELFEFANSDPKGFLATYKNEHGIIIDEAQYAPKLFPQIKVEADRNPQPGYFILSGSQNFLLHEKISESLAGRVYFYTLLPLSIAELKKPGLVADDPAHQMIKGFYPRVYQTPVQSRDYYENYVLTYVERDVRTIQNIENVMVFKKFMQLCALRIGSTLNMSELARDCGITATTAKTWLSLLSTSFILFLLPPYHTNLGKRIIKSPKLYFYDTGLALALLGIDLETLIKRRELYGALFENMVIVDIMKNNNAHGKKYLYSFLRESNNQEIDLILETAGTLLPLEIKSSETLSSSFFDTLVWFQELNKAVSQSLVVYAGDKKQKRSQGTAIPWTALDDITY